MASADAVFLAAHYRAVQRKTSESSTDEHQPKRRSNSILDDIKDGVSKLTGSFSDKKKDFGRRRAMSEIATSGPMPSRGLVEDKRRQWSIKQKSIDSKIKEQPETGGASNDQPQQPHTYTSGKTAQDLINQKRGRLHSAPVQYGRPRSESDAVIPSASRFTSKKETTEEDPDDVFEEAEEEEINHQQQQQKAHGVTRL
jgi:hypothetical protein